MVDEPAHPVRARGKDGWAAPAMGRTLKMASNHETIFTMEATPVKFGRGASEEAGWELNRLGVTRAMLVTDPGVAALGHPERIRKLVEAEGIRVFVYDQAMVEPTIDSFQDAADYALEHEVDGFVSIGGGSSMVKHEYQPPGYPDDHPFVPHGHSVIVTAPAAFRFTYDAMPERHLHVAALLAGEPMADGGPDALPGVLLALMRDVGAPRGVAEFGYTEEDLPELVAGALKQQRLLAVAPKVVGEDDLRHIITASMRNW
jgi:alcohol dehydrogenase class IV